MTPVVESTQAVPFSVAEDGTVRIAGTRVSLESVLHCYEQGATAEEIVLRFPALRLADVHACLAYCLNHPEWVRQYRSAQARRAEQLRECIAADPTQQAGLNRLRERLRRRMAAEQES